MRRIDLVLLGVIALAGCDSGSSEPAAGGHTNWVECDELADCAKLPAAVACTDGYCVDGDGQRFPELSGESNEVSNSPDAETGCPSWSSIIVDRDPGLSCFERGRVCHYPEGVAKCEAASYSCNTECMATTSESRWWPISAVEGCPGQRPDAESSCAVPALTCEYFVPMQVAGVDKMCCNGHTLAWEGQDPSGCPNETPCGTISVRDYDRSCTVDADCVTVNEGDLCATPLCRCPFSAVNAGVVDQYLADYEQVSDGRTGACFCPASQAICKDGVCVVSVAGSAPPAP